MTINNDDDLRHEATQNPVNMIPIDFEDKEHRVRPLEQILLPNGTLNFTES